MYEQNNAFIFFGDHVDAKVSIDSDTIHAPECIACLVLLFADPKVVGAVTEDIMVNRKKFWR